MACAALVYARVQCLRLLTSLIVSAWLSFAGAAPGRLTITVSTPLSLCFFLSVAPAALLSFRTMLLLLLPATEKTTLPYTGEAFAFALAADVCPVPVPVSPWQIFIFYFYFFLLLV